MHAREAEKEAKNKLIGRYLYSKTGRQRQEVMHAREAEKEAKNKLIGRYLYK